MGFPDDANGDLLRQMQDAGLDLSQPRNIDFYHLFDGEAAASAMAEAVRSEVDTVSVELHEQPKRGEWEVCTTLAMVPSHANVTAMEQRLGRIAKPLGGRGDGWGTRQEQ